MRLRLGECSSVRSFLCFTILCISFLSTSQALSEEVDWLDNAVDQALDRYDGGSVLLIGELHGSRETPALAAAIARSLSLRAPVTIALEIPNQEQPRIDRFLTSDGSEESMADLLKGEFWQVAPDKSDGRRSAAMLALIESLRRLSSNAHPPEIVLLDDVDVSGNTDDRRRVMADRIAGLADELESGPVIVLMGNFHARLAPNTMLMMSDGKPIEPPIPTASLVEGVLLTSFDVAACGGEVWACFSETCGPHRLPNLCPNRSSASVTDLDPEQDGYHVRIMLPQHSASPPATSP